MLEEENVRKWNILKKLVDAIPSSHPPLPINTHLALVFQLSPGISLKTTPQLYTINLVQVFIWR